MSEFLFGDGFAVSGGDGWRVRRRAVGPSLHRAYLETMISRVFAPSATHLNSKLQVRQSWTTRFRRRTHIDLPRTMLHWIKQRRMLFKACRLQDRCISMTLNSSYCPQGKMMARRILLTQFQRKTERTPSARHQALVFFQLSDASSRP